MKSPKKISLVLLLACIVMACEFSRDSDNFGYPRKLSFLATGGTTTVNGDEIFTHFLIEDAKTGESKRNSGDSADPNSTLSCTYQWLTVRCKGMSTELEITAEPNTTSKKGRFG